MPTATPSYSLLTISGADATDFLRAQLTTDVSHLGHEYHTLAAWCDAKGRVLCTVRVIPNEDGFLLLIPTELADTISRRLRMYVLRARVEIADTTSEWAIGGMTEATTGTSALPADGELLQHENSLVLGLNTGSSPSALLISRSDTTDPAEPTSGNTWQLTEIDAGLPEINAATSGLFIPQMLNLHWLSAVDFDKGCYPGQEIVARLQYRGQLKRRMFRMQWRGEQPRPGDEVCDDRGTKQGTIVRAAHSCDAANDNADSDEGRLLAVIRVVAAEQALTTDAARLDLLSLPYAVDSQTKVNA